MVTITYQSQLVRLVTELPDWSRSGVTARLTFPTAKSRGLTGRESRTALGGTLRVDLRWESLLVGASVDAFRNPLQVDASASDVPFVVPFWPAMVSGSEAVTAGIGSAGLWIGWDGEGNDWVLTDDPADLAGKEYAAPGLWGRLEASPEVIDTEILRVRMRFTEDGPAAYALAPRSKTWTQGPALPDGTRPFLFPFPVTWDTEPTSGVADVEVDRRAMGPGRIQAAAYYPQNAERPLASSIILSGADPVAEFVRWWADRRGDVEAHYVNLLTSLGHLQTSATIGASSFVPSDSARFGPNGIAILGDGLLEEWVRITGFSGGSANIASPLARDWDAKTTFLQLGMLARHARPDVEIAWEQPGLAVARVTWRECRAELVPGAGESRGGTIGAVGGTAWGYALTIDRGEGSPAVVRLTSWDEDVTAGGHSWSAWPVEHSEIRQSLRMDRDEVTLRLRYRDPLDLFLPGRQDAVLRLSLYRIDIFAGDVAQVWSGEATRLRSEGPFCSISCAGANGLFEREVPRFLIQRGCNYRVFDGQCGLSADGWSMTASVQGVSGNVVTLGTFVAGEVVPVGWGTVHWFALGYLIRSSSSRLLILDSAARVVGGLVDITLLAAPVPSLTVGESVTILPGCDGAVSTCAAKYDNLSHFGGFPWLPEKSPAFQPIRRNEGAGKK